jgi:phosphohistidine phosphatase
MEIYILRHGIAEERSLGGKDRERALTSKGRRKLESLGKHLYELGVSFDAILSSPYLRASETAEVIAACVKFKGEIQFTGNLLPESEPQALIHELKEQPPGGKSILLVGHEPDLSTLASWLLTGGASLHLELKKGGLCKIQVHSFHNIGSATLEWLISPKLWPD